MINIDETQRNQDWLNRIGSLTAELGNERRNTMTNLVDDNKKYKPETIRALRCFKRAKTFHPGTTTETRLQIMQELINRLCQIYSMDPIKVEAVDIDGSHSGYSHYNTLERKIVMVGKLSIITLLHEFAHARLETANQSRVQKWAINLFRKVYPKQFERLNPAAGGVFVESNSSS